MFTTPSAVTTSLHSLSHVAQSLLMRLQADIFLLEKLHANQSDARAKPNVETAEQTAQYAQRCRKTIKQLSVLLEQLFQCLYLTNEPYRPAPTTISARTWAKELETHETTVAPQLKVRAQLTDHEITLDAQLINWTVDMMVRAALQWMQNPARARLRLLPSSYDRIIVELTFTPATDVEGLPMIENQQEHTPIASFYWAAAELAAKQLNVTLMPQSVARKGHIQAEFLLAHIRDTQKTKQP